LIREQGVLSKADGNRTHLQRTREKKKKPLNLGRNYKVISDPRVGVSEQRGVGEVWD